MNINLITTGAIVHIAIGGSAGIARLFFCIDSKWNTNIAPIIDPIAAKIANSIDIIVNALTNNIGNMTSPVPRINRLFEVIFPGVFGYKNARVAPLCAKFLNSLIMWFDL